MTPLQKANDLIDKFQFVEPAIKCCDEIFDTIAMKIFVPTRFKKYWAEVKSCLLEIEREGKR